MEVGTATILKELGRGGSAVVFIAFQRTLKRQIALKILPKSLITLETAERFPSLALKRHLRFINTRPFNIFDVPVAVQVAGAVTNFDGKRTPDSSAFLDTMLTDLVEMANRIKNIHGII